MNLRIQLLTVGLSPFLFALPAFAQPIIVPEQPTAVVDYSSPSPGLLNVTFQGPGNTSATSAFLLVNDAGTNSGTSYNATGSANGSFLLDPVAPLTANISLSLFGATDEVPGSTPGQSIDGGNIRFFNSATITFNNAGGLRPSSGAGLFVSSTGADGFADGTKDPVLSIFDGGKGGNIFVQHDGAITLDGSGTFESGSDLGTFPLLSGIVASSAGGAGNDIQAHDTPQAGDGGNAGEIFVSTTPTSTIEIGNSEAEIVTAGIYASSTGGTAGFNGGDGDTSATGLAGNAGGVEVRHRGSIINSAPSGIGILAESVGGSSAQGNNDNDNEGSGSGGDVAVELGSKASITMTGNSSIGIFAASAAGASNVPPSVELKNEMGGDVGVVIRKGASVTTGNSNTNSRNSIGVLAISSGSASVLNPFNTDPISATGSGSSGEVLVLNDGSISTQGEMAIGIAALSVGGAGIVAGASGEGITYLGNNGTVYSATPASVGVASTGSITTLGATGHGIVAISAGGGGLLNSDVAPVVGSDGTWTSGVAVGANSAGVTGNNGGNVGIEIGEINSKTGVLTTGMINTGDGNGTGNASIGIVAQSIGGSGGTSAGSQPAFLLGDSGGAGGDGGNVDVQLNSLTLHTRDRNSVGVLAQSIGGGGGNGANAAGIFVAVGGNGGNGGDGGVVTANLANGSIQTDDLFSAGLIAQSIGGGGGHGGYADSAGAFISDSIGGTGGSGGVGGNVTVNTAANTKITTAGNQSPGILAQSIGGGGGSGGAATAYAAGIIFTASMAVGGNGGEGGDTGQVGVTNRSDITTGVQAPPGAYGPNYFGSDSIGLIVQSIGGGGGHAGSATARSFSFPSGSAPVEASLSIALGGNGGTAGGGNLATATNLASITTYSDGSHGILAQSIGGGGGVGGDATASSTLLESQAYTAKFSLGAGGNGGSGGDGNVVTVNNGMQNNSGVITPGSIQTFGQNSTGILAQSIGGGGGSAGVGNASAGSPNIGGGDEDESSFNGVLSVGGRGGTGGSASFVTVSNLAGSSVFTNGSGSEGIVAQAIGGGGGKAGGGTSDSSGDKYEGNLSIGGRGGGGGDGGGLTVNNDGSLATQGGDGIGILAQSIGGGGGSGGSSDASASNTVLSEAGYRYLTAPADSYTANLSFGGKGGSGGSGADVTVTNTGNTPANTGITTNGVRAFGILAQSIGGGGGHGGEATTSSNSAVNNQSQKEEQGTYEVHLAMGGKGGTAGDGGGVTIANSGNILTFGYASHGALAQSIGGGGGAGGSGTVDSRSTVGLGASVTGGKGATGDGGGIDINQTGSISTTGADSSGIVAHSIGGGGGHASLGDPGFLVQTPFPDPDIVPPGINETLGINETGSTSGGDGGTVGITHAGKITTIGDWSHGIVGQSIGAGGGKVASTFSTVVVPEITLTLGAKSGNGSGNTAALTLQQGASISTGTSAISSTPSGNLGGFGAYGIVLQSIGGGGGMATEGTNQVGGGTILLGQKGTASGNGGAVTLNVNGTASVTTLGDTAHAIILQSIGGGGGIAATGSSQAVVSGSTAIEVGGSGSFTGTGGLVELSGNAALNIATSGANAFGILAQSIGGSGGLASAQNGVVSFIGSNNLEQINNGGEVAISLAQGSSISTQGVGAHAIVAQSIGGGGGIANAPSSGSPSLATELPGLAVSRGFGNVVSLDINAQIETYGNGAYGILAQSIGGGGGLVGEGGALFAGSNAVPESPDSIGNGGEIFITQAGSITAAGQNSVGIFAQSTAAAAEAVGEAITITVNGGVSGGTGSQGIGIWVNQGFANTLTINKGGSVTSRSGNAILYTGEGELFVTNDGMVGGNVSLEGGEFVNNGTFTPVPLSATAMKAPLSSRQRASRFATATVTGDFVQSRRGEILVRTDFGAGRGDLVRIQGDAQLAGTIRTTSTSVLPLVQIPVLQVSGRITGSPRSVFEAADSVLFDYGLARSGKRFSLQAIDADFAPRGVSLDTLEKAVADHLQQIWNQGGNAEFGKLFAQLDSTAAASLGTYANQLGQLSPGVVLGFGSRRIADLLAFANTDPKDFTQTSRIWGSTAGRSSRQSGDANFTLNTSVTQVGGQTELSEGWFVGGSLAYEYQWLDTEAANASGNGQGGLGALTVKYERDNWLFTGMAFGSFGFYNTTRSINIPGFQAQASGSPAIQTAGFLLRAAYTQGEERFYLRPSVTLSTIYVHAGSYSEDGGGSFGLEVESTDQTTFIATPGIEVGGRCDLPGDRILRPFLGGSVSFLTNDEWQQNARFTGSPAGTGTFRTTIPMDNIVGRLNAGVEMEWNDKLSFSLQYNGEYSENILSNGGSLSAELRF